MHYTNTCDFELTANYMALLACILNPKLSIGKAIKCITLDDPKDAEAREYRKVKPKQNHNYKVKVLDEVENKEIEFDNLSNCCEFLNMRRADITTYIKHNRLFRKRYRIQALEPIRSVERKPVIVTDTLQNKVVEFESINKACKYLGAKRHNINEAIAAKRLFRKRYKLEYKVGNEKHE
ncbi:group I intron endonuclease [[Clostridium] sordellii]|uniref:Group I intron endonuclease n=1 Tax=Paraclostridium sordellii TaxID=1505 RepID=A0A0C7R5G8_PARSO|nr:NUMOD1 domain-containing DNA-binding protein [Paeniclostridium sordellii]CEQ04110.1 group I intron endonuclease [[Clostridium] sordellii] [Paeniclostridium sordellii]